ncbi:MAG: hypothetical protein ABSB40_12040 [Nitrososphaeria archaeon]|jgi:hypothetical protein
MNQSLISPSGEVIQVPDEQVQDALKDGFKVAGNQPLPDLSQTPTKPVEPFTNEGVVAPRATIQAVSPQGKVVNLSKEEAADAFKDGFKPIENVIKEQKIDSASDKLAAELINNSATNGYDLTVASGLLDTLSLGGADKAEKAITNWQNKSLGPDQIKAIQEHYGVDPSDMGEVHVRAYKKIQAQNPITNVISQGIGAIAPMVLTGGAGMFGEGLAATKIAAGTKAAIGATSTLGRIGSAVAGEALAGAAIAAPQAIAQAAIQQDPKGVAETLGWGLLMGGGLGLLAQSGKEAIMGVKAAKEYIAGKTMHIAEAPITELPEGLTEGVNANPVGTEPIKTPTSEADKMLLGQFGVTQKEIAEFGTPAQRAQKVGMLINEIGADKISNMSRAELAQKIIDIGDLSGQRIGGFIKNADAAIKEEPELMQYAPNRTDQINKLEKLAETLDNPLQKTELSYVKKSIQYLKEMTDEPTITFAKQQELKELLQSKVNYKSVENPSLNGIKAEVAKIAKEEMELAADRIAEKSMYAPMIESWKHQKDLYKLAQEIMPGAMRGVSEIATVGSHITGFGGGALAGHALSPLLGPFGPLGTAIGAGIGKLVDRWTRDKGITKLSMWLRKNAENVNMPNYLVTDAATALKSKLQDIPQMLRMAAEHPEIDIIKSALGDEANGLSKTQQFDRLGNHLANMVSNPENTKVSMQQLLSPIAQYHPELASGVMDAMMTKIQVLQDAFPKLMTAPQPFQKDVKREPTTQEINDFKKILAIAENPFHVLEEIKAGTLSQKQVDALNQMNPAIATHIQEEIMESAYNQSELLDLNYNQRLAASVLMGQPMERSLVNLQALQSGFVPPTPQQGPSAPPSGRGRGGSKLDGGKMPGAQYTPSQRIGGGIKSGK